jgi:hypothetical protein
MKAVLKFNLDDPEDKMSHLRCVKATEMMITLWEMDQHLRSITKYAPDSTSQETYDELIKVREMLREIMGNNGISFEGLIE